ncbi:MAG: hypothetical protein COT81_01220 [Candidatus Buchananbacteria bacterium CG10_big_fil_rev_8_21_14_0_10_42_9]|uniref:GIY-YIG domain-containing protein n=1 Tax=Candidatus Buchananbacteria bacterium CG10_big_fil_rev_8_21_14_0_10_42_9 TaxID=1974526 RepID=A0A2H0W211_9BACT|nr:MAG: hypothetical protein COT81_01220 [Candidatus Buchananbacteria bacterium CG10_big_fil_rev_8_21_14_0_10_42_9]
MKKYYVYIMTNKIDTVLYIGVTNDLNKRVWRHKQKSVKGFTQKYNVTKLIYYEEFINVRDAITREKQLKAWKRKWKYELVDTVNPKWLDLYELI